MKKATREANPKKPEDKPPPAVPGYLPTADPPRRNVALLVIAAALLAAWLVALGYLALAP